MAYKIRSKYLKGRVKKLKWTQDNRSYMRKLVLLENAIVDGVTGWSHAVQIHHLRSSYPKEYATMLKELDREGHKEHLKEQAKDVKERRKAERWCEEEDRREEREERGWWGR